MSNANVIQSTLRDKTGKGAVRKMSVEGFIPGVVYGHNFPSIPLSINDEEIKKLFKTGQHDAGEYQLFELLIDGAKDHNKPTVMIKEIQSHPITGKIIHIDFFAVNMNEELVASVQIRVTGKAAGVKAGGILRQILREIDVKSLPDKIPSHFTIDVTNLEIGQSLQVKELNEDEKIQLLSSLDAPVVTVLAPTVQEEETTEEEAVEVEDSSEKTDAEETKE